MIQIARSVLPTTSAKIEKAVGLCSSAIFNRENPLNTTLGGKILARKFGQP
ncbi:MAG: hypothetical protein GTN73_02945 [Candidatus Aminicenantes bacterium]|nr:hypothetical protein [Candidatus Aminicenantes bacterium]